MKFVYILESLDGEHFYAGITDDVPARVTKHNAGEVPHTSKFRPWRLKTYVAFSDMKQAFAFEKYLNPVQAEHSLGSACRGLCGDGSRATPPAHPSTAASRCSRSRTSLPCRSASSAIEHPVASRIAGGTTALAFSRNPTPCTVRVTRT